MKKRRSASSASSPPTLRTGIRAAHITKPQAALHSNRRVLVNIVSRRRPHLKRRERRRCLRNIVSGAFSPEKPRSQGFKYMRVNQRFVRSNLIWGAKRFTSEILNPAVDLPETGTVPKWPK